MPCLGADDPVWRICSLKLLFCRASSVSILNTSFLQDFGWWDTFPGRQTLLDPNNTPWHRTNRPWRPMGHPWQRIVKHFGLLDFRCVPSLTQDMTKNISSQTGISFPFQTPSTRVGISISKHPCSTLYVYIYIFACYFPFTHQIHQESDMFGVSLLRFCRLIRLVRVVKVFRLRSGFAGGSWDRWRQVKDT